MKEEGGIFSGRGAQFLFDGLGSGGASFQSGRGLPQPRTLARVLGRLLKIAFFGEWKSSDVYGTTDVAGKCFKFFLNPFHRRPSVRLTS